MTQSYEATRYYGQSLSVMEKIMEEAVEQYVDNHSQVAYVVDRHNSSITIRIPRYQGAGELVKISVKNKSFHIKSRSIVGSHKIAWGANRREVDALFDSIEKAFQGSALDFA